MPLFGSNHKDNRDTINPDTGHQYSDANSRVSGITGNQGTNAYEPGTGHQYPGNQGTNAYDNNTNEPGTGHQYPHTNTQIPGHQQVQHPHTNKGVPGSVTGGTVGTNAYDNSGRTYPAYHGAGPNSGPVSVGHGPVGHNVGPPGIQHQNDTRAPGGTTGTRVTGKVESAIGSLVGSNTLKTKGLEKEREANLANLRKAELAEAERLEREALTRRQRALGQGNHPANTNAGSGQFGQGNVPAHPGGYHQ